MKKLINAPDDVVADALRGMAAAHPSLTVDVEDKVITRAGGPTAGQGRPGLRRRLRSRAAARRLRRVTACSTPPAPARCSPRRCRTRSCRHQGGRRRRRRPAHREELHRRRAELPDGRRAGRRRGHRGRARSSSTTTSRWRTALYTAGRRGTGATVFVEKIAGALAEQRRGAQVGGRRRPARSTSGPGRSASRSPRAPRRPRGKPGFDLPDDEIELGVGIHGEPGRERGPMRSAARRSSTSRWTPSTTTCRCQGERARDGQRHGRHPADRAVRGLRRGRRVARRPRARPSRAAWSATTSPAWTWPAPRSRCCRLTPDLTALWDAPVETPALRWGR